MFAQGTVIFRRVETRLPKKKNCFPSVCLTTQPVSLSGRFGGENYGKECGVKNPPERETDLREHVEGFQRFVPGLVNVGRNRVHEYVVGPLAPLALLPEASGKKRETKSRARLR